MSTMPATHAFTRAELEALPEDGLRHELIDGRFVMTPAPGIPHQTVSDAIVSMLREIVRGTDLKVVSAPCDVILGQHVVQPDVVVARRTDFTTRDLPTAPTLVVEVLSPSTAHIDTGRKRDLYQESGVDHYWLIDPATPSITVYHLIDGAYTEVAHCRGDRSLAISTPVAITINPAQLLRD